MNETSIWCYKCEDNHPPENFNYGKNGVRTFPCKDCKSKYYYANKNRIPYNKHLLDKRKLVSEITLPLKQQGCHDCSQVFIPEAMEFDHVKEGKQYSISMIAALPVSDEEIRNLLRYELSLCEVCCSNCHRRRTISRYKNSARKDFLDGKLNSKNLNPKSIHAYSVLTSEGCTDCKITDILVLEYDHVRGSKTENISRMLASQRYSLDDLKDEIAKCEVRCAVCHRTKSVKRYNGVEKTEQILAWRPRQLLCACGSSKDAKASQCLKCYNSTKFDPTKYPPVEEIITGVETYGWLPYARTLGMSDNGLRNALKKFGVNPLPSKKLK